MAPDDAQADLSGASFRAVMEIESFPPYPGEVCWCGHPPDEHSEHAGCFHSKDGQTFCGCMRYRETFDE